MIDRIAEAMGVGRTPLALGRSLTLPASAVVAAVTGQPLELVRPLMESLESDLLPRDPARGAAPLRHPPAALRPRRRARSARVGVARAAGGAVRVERRTHIAAPPKDGLRHRDGPGPAQGLGHDSPPPRGLAGVAAAQGLAAHPVPQARGQELQGRLAGGRERALRARGVGGTRAGRLSRARWSTASNRMARAPTSPTSTSTTCPAGRSVAWRVARSARVTQKELEGSLQRLKQLVE